MNTRFISTLFIILIGTAGIAIAQTEWTDHPDNPVIGLGEPGEWDDGGRIPLAVHFDSSSFHLWFLGIKTGEGPGDIGHATSTDGVDWTIDSANPVLRRGGPGEWDDGFLFGAGVVHDGTQYHLWYSGVGAQTGAYQGGYATSTDGSVWTKHPDNPVLTGGPVGAWDEGGVDPHTVILEDGVYRMWYTAGTAFVLLETGYAESTDGVHWTKHPDNPVFPQGESGEWDGLFINVPSIFYDGSTYHMWYSGCTGLYPLACAIGYASSPDGIAWTKHPDNPVLTNGAPGEWDSTGAVFGSQVLYDGAGTFTMWYGWVSENPSVDGTAIGLATSTDGVSWTRYAGNPVLTSGPDEELESPAVVFDGQTYHMWYLLTYPSTAIGYASSPDGIAWTKHPDPVFLGAVGEHVWDEKFYSQAVFLDGGTFHMLYSADTETTEVAIGYASSADGSVWTMSGAGPVLTPGVQDVDWDACNVGLPGVIARNGEAWMYYYAWPLSLIHI